MLCFYIQSNGNKSDMTLYDFHDGHIDNIFVFVSNTSGMYKPQKIKYELLFNLTFNLSDTHCLSMPMYYELYLALTVSCGIIY